MTNIIDPKTTENFIEPIKAPKFSLLLLIMNLLTSLPELLGKVVKGAVILFVVAHFVPELREVMPEFFIFIEDGVFKLVNWAFGQVNGIIF